MAPHTYLLYHSKGKYILGSPGMEIWNGQLPKLFGGLTGSNN